MINRPSTLGIHVTNQYLVGADVKSHELKVVVSIPVERDTANPGCAQVRLKIEVGAGLQTGAEIDNGPTGFSPNHGAVIAVAGDFPCPALGAGKEIGAAAIEVLDFVKGQLRWKYLECEVVIRRLRVVRTETDQTLVEPNRFAVEDPRCVIIAEPVDPRDHERDMGAVDRHKHVVQLVGFEVCRLGRLYQLMPAGLVAVPHLHLVVRDVDPGILEVGGREVVEDNVGIRLRTAGGLLGADLGRDLVIDRHIVVEIEDRHCLLTERRR